MGDYTIGLVAEMSEETGPESVGIYGMLQIESVNDLNHDCEQCEKKQHSKKVFDEIRHKLLFIVLPK